MTASCKKPSRTTIFQIYNTVLMGNSKCRKVKEHNKIQGPREVWKKKNKHNRKEGNTRARDLAVTEGRLRKYYFPEQRRMRRNVVSLHDNLFIFSIVYSCSFITNVPEGSYKVYAFGTQSIHHRCCKTRCTWSPTVLHYAGPEFLSWSLWPLFQSPPGSIVLCRYF